MSQHQTCLAFTILSTLLFVTFVSALVHYESPSGPQRTPRRPPQARQYSSLSGTDSSLLIDTFYSPPRPTPLPNSSPPSDSSGYSVDDTASSSWPTAGFGQSEYTTDSRWEWTTAHVLSVTTTTTSTFPTPAEPLATEDGRGPGLMGQRSTTAAIFGVLVLLVVLLTCATLFLFLRKRRSRMLEGSRSEKEHLRPNRPPSAISLSSSTSQPTLGSATGSSLTGAMDLSSFGGSAYAPSHYGDGQDWRSSRFSALSASQSVISPMMPATTRNSVLGAGYTNGGVYYSRDRAYNLPRSSAYAKYKTTPTSLDTKEPPLEPPLGLDEDPFRRIPTPVSGSSSHAVS